MGHETVIGQGLICFVRCFFQLHEPINTTPPNLIAARPYKSVIAESAIYSIPIGKLKVGKLLPVG